MKDYSNEVYVPCVQGHTNCFAYREDGTCDCLLNTEFKKVCPFFKDKNQYKREIEEDIKRKKENPSFPF